MSFTVKCLGITPPLKPSALAGASVSIELGDGERIILSDIRILKNNLGEAWVALPSHAIKRDGGYIYGKTVELSDGLKRSVNDAVLGAWKEGAR